MICQCHGLCSTETEECYYRYIGIEFRFESDRKSPASWLKWPIKLFAKIPVDSLDRGVFFESVAAKFAAYIERELRSRIPKKFDGRSIKSECHIQLYADGPTAERMKKEHRIERRTNTRLLLPSERDVIVQDVILIDPHLEGDRWVGCTQQRRQCQLDK